MGISSVLETGPLSGRTNKEIVNPPYIKLRWARRNVLKTDVAGRLRRYPGVRARREENRKRIPNHC